MDKRVIRTFFFLNAYKKIGMKESDVMLRRVSLIGFKGESKNTIRETVLPVYAEGVKNYTKFLILESFSAYNVILGRP